MSLFFLRCGPKFRTSLHPSAKTFLLVCWVFLWDHKTAFREIIYPHRCTSFSQAVSLSIHFMRLEKFTKNQQILRSPFQIKIINSISGQAYFLRSATIPRLTPGNRKKMWVWSQSSCKPNCDESWVWFCGCVMALCLKVLTAAVGCVPMVGKRQTSSNAQMWVLSCECDNNPNSQNKQHKALNKYSTQEVKNKSHTWIIGESIYSYPQLKHFVF